MNDAVLITGATGFAGSFLVEHYLREGYVVHGTYRQRHDAYLGQPDGVRLHRIDLRDLKATEDLVAAVRPVIVHHLAAQSSVSVSLQHPLETMIGNVEAQFSVLEAVRRHAALARVLIVGSCDEYGSVAPHDNPVDETQSLRPETPYALSKVNQDLMGQQYAIAYGLHVVRVRPFLQIGPRRPERFVAGSFARQVAEIVLGRREPVIGVGRLDMVRDFIDVRDAAVAYALAAQLGTPGEVYNIASGRGHQLRELLDCMLVQYGISAEIQPDPRRLRVGETSVLIGDARRLRDKTGWRPTVEFEKSVGDTVRYWLDRLQEEPMLDKENAQCPQRSSRA